MQATDSEIIAVGIDTGIVLLLAVLSTGHTLCHKKMITLLFF